MAYERCLFPHAYPWGVFSRASTLFLLPALKPFPPPTLGPACSRGEESPFSRCPGPCAGQDRAGPGAERPRPAERGRGAAGERGAGGWKELRVPCRRLRSHQSSSSSFPTPPRPRFLGSACCGEPRGPAALGPAGGNHQGRLFGLGGNRPCVALAAVCVPAVKMGDKYHRHPPRTPPSLRSRSSSAPNSCGLKNPSSPKLRSGRAAGAAAEGETPLGIFKSPRSSGFASWLFVRRTGSRKRRRRRAG